jgi:hypothetical protein
MCKEAVVAYFKALSRQYLGQKPQKKKLRIIGVPAEIQNRTPLECKSEVRDQVSHPYKQRVKTRYHHLPIINCTYLIKHYAMKAYGGVDV